MKYYTKYIKTTATYRQIQQKWILLDEVPGLSNGVSDEQEELLISDTRNTFMTKCDNSNTGYLNHILNTGHTNGTIKGTMEIMEVGRKEQYLNTFEKYRIHKVSRKKLHMNDISTDAHNPIFEELHRIYTG
jgi:hypothetical protein